MIREATAAHETIQEWRSASGIFRCFGRAWLLGDTLGAFRCRHRAYLSSSSHWHWLSSSSLYCYFAPIDLLLMLLYVSEHNACMRFVLLVLVQAKLIVRYWYK
jgi:hypothetical protein